MSAKNTQNLSDREHMIKVPFWVSVVIHHAHGKEEINCTFAAVKESEVHS
jgi:hypothetical protein